MNSPFLVNNPYAYNSIDYENSTLNNEKKMNLGYGSNHDNKPPKFNRPYSKEPLINNGIIESGNLRLPPANFIQNSNGKNASSQPRVSYGGSYSYDYENYSQKNDFINSKSPVTFINNTFYLINIQFCLDEKSEI